MKEKSELLNSLYEELHNHREYSNKLLDRKPIVAASLLLTEDCNLGCRYCYEIKFHKKQTSMTPETGEKSIDFLVEGLRNFDEKEHNNKIGIMLFGGEPTLNVKTMRAVKERADYYKERRNIEFEWNLITNTTIYTEELGQLYQEFMDDYKVFTVQMSVDGAEETQNTSRVYKNGSGSYNEVIKTIPKYKELFAKNKREKDLNIHGVLDAGNIGKFYENFLHHRVDLGIESVWFIPAHNGNWEKEHIDVYKEQLGLVTQWILDDVKKTKNLNEVRNYNPLNRVFEERKGYPSKPCGAGEFYISINHKGEIYPCHQIYFSNREKNDTYSGNIFDGIDVMSMQIFNDYSNEDLTCPTTCTHYNCFRCIAENLSANGSLFSQIHGHYCELMKVDQYYQDYLKEELTKMGLFETRNNRPKNIQVKKFDGNQYATGEEYNTELEKYLEEIKEEYMDTNQCLCNYRGTMSQRAEDLIRQGAIIERGSNPMEFQQLNLKDGCQDCDCDEDCGDDCYCEKEKEIVPQDTLDKLAYLVDGITTVLQDLTKK